MASPDWEVPTVVAGPPLDYSFKELKSCTEIETEEPRGGGARRLPPPQQLPPAAVAAEGAAAADGVGAKGAAAGIASANPSAAAQDAADNKTVATSTPGGTLSKGLAPPGTPRSLAHAGKRVVRKISVAVKLNNNSIETLQDLPQSLTCVMEDPLRNLLWLDMSFNKLSSIEPALVQLVGLKALYLHGNAIKSLPSVERLRKLPKLISLTLNGNPVESNRCYHYYVIGALAPLRQLDHSTITEEEKQNASGWFKAHQKRLNIRLEKMRESAYLDSMNS